MNDDDALPFEMRQRPGRREAPPTVDDETADRLLAGQLDPADAPPGYAAVAKLVAAATGPATTDELAGEPEAIARFAATARSGFPTRASITRRAGVPRRLLTVKAAAAVLVAALSVGGVAVAAGVFPAPARPAADHGRGSSGSGPATPGASGAATTTTAAGNRERGNGTATGPDATGPAKDGLCRAWEAGQAGEHGRRQDSTAFRALVAAAGGADKIAAYCQATTPGQGKGTEKDKGHEQGQGQGQGQNPPPGGGAGHGSGGPPTTG
jgi:hypothetical protein